MRSTNEIIKDVLRSNNQLLEVLSKYDTSSVAKLSMAQQIENNNRAIELL